MKNMRLDTVGINIASLRRSPPSSVKLIPNLPAWGFKTLVGDRVLDGVLGVGGAVWAGDGNPVSGFAKGWGAFIDPSKCTSADVNNPQTNTQGACFLATIMDNYVFGVAQSGVGSISSTVFKKTFSQCYSKSAAAVGESEVMDPTSITEDAAEKIGTVIAENDLVVAGTSAISTAMESVIATMSSGPVGYAIMAAQTIGMVIDMFDPEEYGSFISDNNINAIIAGMAANMASNEAAAACGMLTKIFKGPLFTVVAKNANSTLCDSMKKLKKCITYQQRMYPKRKHPFVDVYSMTSDPTIKSILCNYMIDYLRFTSAKGVNTQGYVPPPTNEDGEPEYSEWVRRVINSAGKVLQTPIGAKRPDPTKHVHTPLQEWYLNTVITYVQTRNPTLAASMTAHMNVGLALSLVLIVGCAVIIIGLIALASSKMWK